MKYHYSLENYHSSDMIGQGHFSTVYKSVDVTNNRYVAIKKIRMELFTVIPALEWPLVGIPKIILREIDLLERLEHRNIISLLEVVVEKNKQINLIFEYLDMDLSKYLDRLFPSSFMDPQLVKSYLYQINTALIHCQENFIVHRDIKPLNLLISTNGVIKLADFGSAVSLEVPVEHYSNSVVTLPYRPPEVLLKARSHSYPIDIWSLGCVFAEMVTKKSLFQGSTKESQLTEIFSVLTTPTEETWPGVASLDGFNELPKNDHENLEEKVPQLDEYGLDLLRSMLICDPNKRINVIDIAVHEFFDNIDLNVEPNFDEVFDNCE